MAKGLGVLLARDRLPRQSLLCMVASVRSEKASMGQEGEQHPADKATDLAED